MSLRKAFRADNLERAWRWIRSNPDAQYKSYFSETYKAYALADEAYLKSLRQRLVAGTYRPGHATKLYYPKPSGLLRTYTLLNIEDQLSYQAMVNIVAERLFPHVRHRYGKEVFGHLYGGKGSVWFYRKWSEGYKQFNEHIRKTIDDGYIYAATFDLTAFYDSVDHGVLRYFLERLKLDSDFVSKLLSWLEHWTASGERIYHGHGIPQGPLPSGLLSETVLQYFDSNKRLPQKTRYFRYIDDIRLYGKDPDSIRAALISFDYLSKFLGLFPQSSKIALRQVRSVEDELKSISKPSESVIASRKLNQGQLRRRLVELSPKLHVTNPTRFKYLLAHATPWADLSLRLLRIVNSQPFLYQAVFRYFNRYESISPRVSGMLLKQLKIGPPYFSYKASLIKAVCGRIHHRYRWRFSSCIRIMWKQRLKYKHAADLREAMLQWMIHEGMLPYRQLRVIFCRETLEPWVRSMSAQYLDRKTLGNPSYEALLNEMLKDGAVDPAVVAGHLLIRNGLRIQTSVRNMNHVSAEGMRFLGVVRGRARPPSLVPKALAEVCGRSLTHFDWKRAFRNNHRFIERQALLAAGYVKTDMTAFVNALDVLNDRFLATLASHDRTTGIYQLGNIGSFLGSSTSVFARTYPHFHRACKRIHELRLKSDLSHPVVRGSGRPTGRIKFSHLRSMQKVLYAGYEEVIGSW